MAKKEELEVEKEAVVEAPEALEEKAEEVKETKAAKKKEETVKVHIPIDQLNPKDLEIIVGINEKYAKVMRGQDQEVSIPVFEQLRNAGLV